MIKINLLPQDRQKKEFPIWKLYRVLVYLFLGITLVVWAVSLGLYKYSSSKLEDINNQISGLSVWQQRYDKAQLENADIRKRTTVLNNLNKTRMGWTPFMAELGNATPYGCWVDTVTQNAGSDKKSVGDVLVIKGGAKEMDLLLEYVTRLQGMPNVIDVQIQQTAEQEKNKIKVIDFTLNLARTGVAKK